MPGDDEVTTDTRPMASCGGADGDGRALKSSSSCRDAAWRRRIGYVLAGGVGFVVDAAVLSALVTLAAWGPIAARGPSFLLAVSVTWLINRTQVFADRRAHSVGKEYRLYFVVQALGALANLLVFATLIWFVPALAATPVLPLMVGAVAGLVVNYQLNCRVVFPQGSS